MLKKLTLIICLIISVFLFQTSCKKKVDDAKRGVTDTTIKIGQWGPQSGPASLWGAVARGTEVYFKMINDEGGIAGRKIEYFIRDDGYQPDRTKTEVMKLVEGEGVFGFVGGLGTATGMAVMQYLNENKVPWVDPSSPSQHWTYPHNKYLFTIYPLACTEDAILIEYAVNVLGKKKIAVIYQNDDYGKFGLYGAEVALEKYNLKLAERVSVEMTDTDLSSHVLKLSNSGADTVILWVMPKHAQIIMNQCAKAGYKAQFMTSSTLSDMAIMYKITKGLWKDVIFGNFVEMPDSNNALMVKYHNAQKKYAPNERWGVFYYAGILFAEPMVEALKKCGKDLTNENFVKAMESIKDFQGIGPKITYTPKKHQGADSIFLAKCISETQYIKLTDWKVSDINVEEVIKRMK